MLQFLAPSRQGRGRRALLLWLRHRLRSGECASSQRAERSCTRASVWQDSTEVSASLPEPRSDSPTAESDSIPTAFRQFRQSDSPTVRQSDSSPTVFPCVMGLVHRPTVRQRPTASDSPTVRQFRQCPTIPTVRQSNSLTTKRESASQPKL